MLVTKTDQISRIENRRDSHHRKEREICATKSEGKHQGKRPYFYRSIVEVKASRKP